MARCAECTYLDLNYGNDSSGAFWCDKKCERHLATDPECGNFCRAYNRNSNTISNAIDCSNSHNSEGCYLTTMLCNVLKMTDNNIYLQTMRKFRQNILQKDEKYKSILVEYDIIGPKIAEALSNDPLKEKIARIYFDNFIVPITEFIKTNQTERAINKYYQMTNNLKSFYGITDYNITLEKINNADIEKSGRGKYIQKKITL